MSRIEQIEFQGERYWLIPGGSITKPDDYLHGRMSYAHLMPDGTILRFRRQIGVAADVIRLGPVPDDVTWPDDPLEWFSNMLRWPA